MSSSTSRHRGRQRVPQPPGRRTANGRPGCRHRRRTTRRRSRSRQRSRRRASSAAPALAQVGAANAAYAGAGVKVGEGSAARREQEITQDYEHDAYQAILEGKRRARGLQTDAQMTRIDGSAWQTAGYVNAAGTLLGGAYQGMRSTAGAPGRAGLQRHAGAGARRGPQHLLEQVRLLMATIPRRRLRPAHRAARPARQHPARRIRSPLRTDHRWWPAQSIGNDMPAQQTRRDERASARRRRWRWRRRTTSMHDAHDEVARGVQDGSIPPTRRRRAADARGQDPRHEPDRLRGCRRSAQRWTRTCKNTDGHAAAQPGTAPSKSAAARTPRHDRPVRRAGFTRGMRSGPAWAAQKYSAPSWTSPAARQAGRQAARKAQAGFSEKVHADFYTQCRRRRRSPRRRRGAAQPARTAAAGPEGDPLDPHQARDLTHTLFGWEQSILAKQDRAANRRNGEARQALQRGGRRLQQGRGHRAGRRLLLARVHPADGETAAGTDMAPRCSG
jgi:hypothetical protein